MAETAVRFIHASDCHLERVVGGVATLTDRLRDDFAVATRRACRQLFDAAIEHQVDFLALAGDVIDARLAGPAEIEFLRGQFQRLAKQQIRVYWACGLAEQTGPWPLSVPLPDNVVVFDRPEAKAVVHRRDRQRVARIVGRSVAESGRIAAGDLVSPGDDLPTIGLAYGRTGPAEFRRLRGLRYVALGGCHRPRHVAGSEGRWEVRYSGPPQAFRPGGAGPRGCVLVEISGPMALHTQMITTHHLRWQDEVLEPPAHGQFRGPGEARSASVR